MAPPRAIGCLSGALVDSDAERDGTQPRCTVKQIGPDGSVAVIPSCSDPAERPCFDLVLDSSCDGGHLVDIRRDVLPPAGTEVAVRCDVYVTP